MAKGSASQGGPKGPDLDREHGNRCSLSRGLAQLSKAGLVGDMIRSAMQQRKGTRWVMNRTIVVSGRLSDSRHVELDEPVTEIEGPVEVVLRPAKQKPTGTAGRPVAVLDAMRALPNLEAGDVDELERMIEEGKLPTASEGLFDREGA